MSLISQCTRGRPSMFTESEAYVQADWLLYIACMSGSGGSRTRAQHASILRVHWALGLWSSAGFGPM